MLSGPFIQSCFLPWLITKISTDHCVPKSLERTRSPEASIALQQILVFDTTIQTLVCVSPNSLNLTVKTLDITCLSMNESLTCGFDPSMG